MNVMSSKIVHLPTARASMTQVVQGLSSKQRPSLSLVRNQRFREDEITWSAWMVAAQNGDQSQYQALLEALGQAIEQYLRVHFGGIDFIEDCVQECLIAVHQGRHTYNPERPFRPWLFTVVRNKAVDLLRKRRPDQTHGEEAGEWNQPASNMQAETLVHSEDLFKHLAEPYREALILTRIMGYTAKEAARKVGVSLPAMKVRVFRALSSLKKQLAEDGVYE